MLLGTGDIDEAEDGETILHEFGHAIQDASCREFGQSNEAAAIGAFGTASRRVCSRARSVRYVVGRFAGGRADRVIIESPFPLDPFTTFARDARAILDANQHLYGGEHDRSLRAIFKGRAIGIHM